MPESITLTVPYTFLSVTSPARTGVTVLSTASSSLTVTEKGIKGDTGATGATGPAGPQGIQGP